MNKNHEGYSDPTACKAIRRADRPKKKGTVKRDTLTYHIGEAQGFDEIRKLLR